MRNHDKPDAATLRALGRIFDSVQVMRSLYPGMPSSYITAFLLVALKPGLGVTDYAREMGTTQPIMSRILLEIGTKARVRDEPLGLVDRIQDDHDLRLTRYVLTPKGRTLMASMARTYGGVSSQD